MLIGPSGVRQLDELEGLSPYLRPVNLNLYATRRVCDDLLGGSARDLFAPFLVQLFSPPSMVQTEEVPHEREKRKH